MDAAQLAREASQPDLVAEAERLLAQLRTGSVRAQPGD